jgi:DNA-binding SARP family transcriptional activator
MGQLGLFRDPTEGEPVLGGGKPVALLVYLALSPGGRARRDHLARIFWMGVPIRDARHSLRQSRYRLRQVTRGFDLIGTDGAELVLDPAVRFDFLEGEQAASEGDAPTSIRLLRRDFLEDFQVSDSREFHAWAEAQRVRFRELWAEQAALEADRSMRAGEPGEALALAEAIAGHKPFDDAPIRLVMESLAELDRHASALARFHEYRERLRQELDDEPEPELEALAEEVAIFVRSRSAREGNQLPFVGRAREWAALETAWRDARSGRVRTVLIAGDAGLGKSRLLHELRIRGEGSGALVLSTKCHEVEGAVPYAPVADALSQAMHHPRLGELRPSWLAEASRLLPEVRERFPDLRPLPGAMGAQGSARRLHRALGRLLEAVSVPEGVVMAVDDVHWADPGSLEVLHHFSHRLQGSRLLLLVTYRPGELGRMARRYIRSLLSEGLGELLTLTPLEETDVRELLERITPFNSEALAGEAARRFQRHAGGSPLVIGELLRALEENDVLQKRDGRWRVRRGARMEDVPRTLDRLLAERLARLDPWARACAETLAVCADQVHASLLSRLTELPTARVRLALDVLEEEHLVRRTAAGDFELIHDELQNLVYERIPEARRRRLHRLLANALEGAGDRRWPEGAARLSPHSDLAGRPALGPHYVRRTAWDAGTVVEERGPADGEGRRTAPALPPGLPPPVRRIGRDDTFAGSGVPS